MTRLAQLRREKEFLLRELEPFQGRPHSNPWALQKEEELRKVEHEITELEAQESK